MGIFSGFFKRRGHAPSTPRHFKIRITTVGGETLYWHKRGRLHTVEEDVADIFVASFKPELFQVRPDGSLSPPDGGTRPIARVDKEPA